MPAKPQNKSTSVPQPKTTSGTLQHAQNKRNDISPSFKQENSSVRMPPKGMLPSTGGEPEQPKGQTGGGATTPQQNQGQGSTQQKTSTPQSNTGRTAGQSRGIMNGQDKGGKKKSTPQPPMSGMGKFITLEWWQNYLGSFLTIEGWLNYINPIKEPMDVLMPSGSEKNKKGLEDIFFKYFTYGSLAFTLKIILLPYESSIKGSSR